MYFLSEDERRYVSRRLLPEARKIDVHEELRGWHWAAIDAPLRPTYSPLLGVAEVANGYCASGRDVYVRRVLGQQPSPSKEMAEGTALHACAAAWVTAAKRLLYATPLPRLLDELPALLDAASVIVNDDSGPDLIEKMRMIRRFETNRLVAAVQEAIARQPDAGPDALVAQVLPVVVEQRIDGRFLGLSRHLAIDAFTFCQPMVVDLKFGARHEFHRLSTTGYALALESVYEAPIALGCMVYVQFRHGALLIERDFHVIDDELRSRFIEERDQKQRLVQEDLDPGLPAQCAEHCPHLSFCGAEASQRAARTWPRTASRRPVSANPVDQPTPAPLETDYIPPRITLPPAV